MSSEVGDGAGAVRVGLVFRPEHPPERLREVVGAAESAGFDELWVWEDCFLQGGIAQAAAALAWTSTITVGIGVLPAPQRNVAVTAMEIASLDRMFPGRVRVGIGHGEQDWMVQVGHRVASPMTLLREYLCALGDLLAGRSVTVEGRYVRLGDVTLGWAPPRPVPILVAARGPKTLALSAEIGHGTILDCLHTPDTVAAAGAFLSEARGRGDTAQPHSTVMYLVCAPGAYAAERLHAEAASWGFGYPERFGVGGSIDQIAGSTAPYIAAGVDTVVFQPPVAEDDYGRYIAATAGVVELIRGIGRPSPASRPVGWTA